MNIKKDIERGRGSRLADGAKLFDPADDSHVERTTPLQTKRKQMLAAEDAGIDAMREASTTRKHLVPSTPGNSTGLHVHAPVGVSASAVNNPSDSPAPSKSGVQVTAKISQANGGPRFSNPS